MRRPAARRPLPICSRQPGLPLVTMVRAAAADGGDLAVADAPASAGSQQRVDARAAAAGVGVLERHQLEAGDAAQEPLGRLADLLGVQQVAGLVVGHRAGERRRPRPGGFQPISHRNSETSRILRAEGRRRRRRPPAARRSGGARRCSRRRSRRWRRSPGRRRRRTLSRASALACSRAPLWMCRAPQQRSPPSTSTSQPFSVSTRTVASLTLGEQLVGQAPGEQRHPVPPLAARGKHAACRGRRRQAAAVPLAEGPAGHVGRLGRGRRQPPRAAGLRAPASRPAAVSPSGLLQPQQLEHQPLRQPRRQQHREPEPAHQPGQGPTLAHRLQHGAGALEDVPVLHPRGAGGLAGPAVEALVEVAQHLAGGRDLALAGAPSSGRCARGASPSPPAARGRWGRPPGTARSARRSRPSRRKARPACRSWQPSERGASRVQNGRSDPMPP